MGSYITYILNFLAIILIYGGQTNIGPVNREFGSLGVAFATLAWEVTRTTFVRIYFGQEPSHVSYFSRWLTDLMRI